MVALLFDSSLIGGGSIIAPNVVVTSANKVEKLDPKELIVRAGEWDLESEAEPFPHADRYVKQVILHERFSRTARNNDIALLVLKVPFSSQPNIAPICLPTHGEKFDQQRCIVAGWGKKVGVSTDYPHVLKEISLKVLPEALCNDYLSKILEEDFKIDPTSICAGGEKDVDTCLGDGGAPLICPIEGSADRYKLAGIVAWGVSCGMENVPGAYTNVAALTPWISEKLKQLTPA
ncbi:hypothetical protein KR093_006803 [Drosophila rubida]|uniref:Peptidase S1 domain-containing protein n=1 Tax=Drosophila rubida TaxID=30044 RepID=A0AAD4K7V1_9MUSC|nr:hypothetical protein KR093_006803 [Drosophila rubida]